MTRALALALALLWAGEVQACLWIPHAALAKQLETKFKESPIVGGLTKQASLLQIFATRGGETWTAVIVRPNGLSCIISAGEWWVDLAQVKTGDPT